MIIFRLKNCPEVCFFIDLIVILIYLFYLIHDFGPHISKSIFSPHISKSIILAPDFSNDRQIPLPIYILRLDFNDVVTLSRWFITLYN